MSEFKFILGFVAGWIATTKEGKEFANKAADATVKFVKSCTDKAQTKTEKEGE